MNCISFTKDVSFINEKIQKLYGLQVRKKIMSKMSLSCVLHMISEYHALYIPNLGSIMFQCPSPVFMSHKIFFEGFL